MVVMAAATNLLRAHAFANNPLRLLKLEPSAALEALTSGLAPGTGSTLDLKVLPFRKGRPLARSSTSAAADTPPVWRLAWLPPSAFANQFSPHSFVFLGGDGEGFAPHSHWAIDLSSAPLDFDASSPSSSFVDLRTLMVATDWADHDAMGQLAIAGQAKALLEWHSTSRFCGQCGATMTSLDAGRRKQCTAESCKKRMYPRVDPVVIMLVIDKENDRALLSRQSRFVPRMWSCLAGFIEPGESLEEAVRRETLEETGVEVGEVVYHSSQPWPVGPSSMPCQLMVGFFAYAKTLEIRVDKMELEDAQWHSREDVRRALASADYEKARRTSAAKVDRICKGVEKAQGLSSDSKGESAELASMFVPGPFAIAHHLISSWVGEAAEFPAKPSSSSSNL